MSDATDGFVQDFDEGDPPPSSDIAIVGMALRVPGANGPDQYWENLRDGVESVRELTEDELRAAGVEEAQLNHPRYVRMGAPMDDVKGFDAALFGFSPRDAAIMDPQHRHFLEVSWEALEHAGYDPARYDGAIGVFGGSGHNVYMAYNLLTNPDLMDSVGFFLVRHTSNDKDFLVTRVSYLFDLNGPAVNVQTACSTSLVAVHMGVQSLLNGESDMILAGGVTIDMPLDNGYIHEPGEILSRDGHCRTFDADSSGTVFGSGAGVVVLKRLDDALADGDTVHAVIRGTAINNDGSNKVGYLAPSVDGQAAAVSEAIALADVDPATIQYVECHGTGTEIGDPIEVAALNQVFKGQDPDTETATGYCALGSVKTNIGHLDTAAGIASLIKATLALSNKAIPPTLHFEKPNPKIDFEGSPFYVNNELRPWESGIDGEPRRAGISSLGVGGTNAHIILEEAPELDETTGSRRWQLLPLSAKGPTALDESANNLAEWLRSNPDADLADVAHTLRSGRRDLDKRRFVVIDTETEDTDRIADIVSGAEPKRITNGTSEPKDRPVVFMFTGQGSQYAGMGRDLYESEPAFRDTVDECADILRPIIGLDIRSLLFPDADKTESADEQLAQTAMTQPALFTIEYAMAKLWISWGVTPKAMIGHSIGEYTAACVAGVLSVADALRVVATRGRLMQELPGGSMLAIPLAADKVTDYLGDGLSLAARNGPEFCVVAGPDDAVDVLQAKLEGEDLAVRRLHTSHAFHSSMMDPMLDPFTEVVSGTARNQPDIPYVSNVTGTWIAAEQLADPGYWASHVRGAVDFVGGLRTILEADPEAVLLEVGPGRTLSTFAKQLPGDHTKTVVTSIRPPKARDGGVTDDAAVALGALGELWAHGAITDWADFVGDEQRRRIPLPTYPFQHQEFWVEPGEQIRMGGGGGGLTRKPDVADWFWEPTWSRTPWPTAVDSLLTEFAELDASDAREDDDDAGATGDDTATAEAVVPHWLIFDDGTLGSRVVERLTEAGATVTVVAKSDGYALDDAGERGAGSATIDPADPEQHARLVRELVEADHAIRGVVHLWPLTTEPTLDPADPAFASAQVDTFYAPLHTVQALGSEGDGGAVDHWIVTRDQHAVTGGEIVDPVQALSLGPALVVGREHPSIRSRTLDLTAPAVDHPAAAERIVVELLADSTGAADDAVIAHRGRTRWVRGHEAASTPEEPGRSDPIRDGGVYLITGGTGGIGLALAEHLAEAAKAKLVLTSRTGLPERDRWDDYDRSHSIGRKVARIRAMEAAGAEVLVLAADAADVAAMTGVVASATERFGTVHGVFHAAGHLADGLMAMKETADAEAVLAAKVTGTVVLERALADAGVDLDFLALFSSTSAVVGNAGQVDYVAANAYLNAFAQRRCLEAGPDGHPTVAIGWGPWAEVGMTVRTAVDMGLLEDTDRLVEVDHPLLDRWGRSDDAAMGNGAAGDVFETDFSPATHWLLDEHRTKPGTALLPGTGYLDLITATHRSREGHGPGEMAPLELSNVMFLAPFLVGDDDATTLRVRYENGDGDLVIASGTGPTATEHARGRVRTLNGAAPAATSIDLEPIRARCAVRTAEFDRYEHEQLAWGPRWDNLRRIDYGDREALASLALPDQFVADLADHPLHPAVLDLATAGAQDLIDGFSAGRDFFVPFSYGRLTQYRPLTGQVFSHIRYRESGGDGASGVSDSAVFDVTLVDPDGTVLVEIEAFTMRRAAGEIADAAMPGDGTDGSAADPLLESIENGIGTDDGMTALRRILAGRAATGIAPEVVVVAQDLKALIRRADDEAAAQSGGGGAGISHERPDLSTPYVEPSTDREQAIADIWEDMLGVAGVGIHDDFYELGGHSLLVTQLSARVKKLTTAEVPLMALFESSTIAELSAAIDQAEADLAADGGAPAPKLGRVSRDGHRVRRGAINLAAADGGTPAESKNDGPATEAGPATPPQ